MGLPVPGLISAGAAAAAARDHNDGDTTERDERRLASRRPPAACRGCHPLPPKGQAHAPMHPRCYGLPPSPGQVAIQTCSNATAPRNLASPMSTTPSAPAGFRELAD